MHELSLALEIGRIAEAHAGVGGAKQVTTVGVEVGDEAGVEVTSLTFCLEAVLAAPPFAGATPAITRLPGTVLRVTYVEVDDGRPDD